MWKKFTIIQNYSLHSLALLSARDLLLEVGAVLLLRGGRGLRGAQLGRQARELGVAVAELVGGGGPRGLRKSSL